MSTTATTEELRKRLRKLGAREFEVVALTMEPNRGLAALTYAVEKGAEHPVSYAIKLFDSPDWQPSGELPRRAVNVSVDVECKTCGGNRFVLVGRRQAVQSMWMRERGLKPSGSIEEYAACPDCNPANTSFRRADGSVAKALDPAKVRELLQR